MISAENISVQIGHTFLIREIDIQFDSGKFNLIIGPNGSGKSTLIRVLSGQTKPQSGRVLLDGRELKSLNIRELAKRRAVLSQHIEIPFPLMAEEVVMMGRYPHFIGKPGTRDKIAVQESMKLFDIAHLTSRNYQTLSGGEKQRVNFARVLSQIWYPENDSRILLLDEPLTFLDVHFQFEFMHHLVELLKQSNLVVVGVVHDLNLAARFGDYIVLLHEGKILAKGNRDAVLTKEHIKTAFQLEPLIHRYDEDNFLSLVFR